MAFAYSTYLGGSSDDPGSGIAVDSAGNAYINGSTASTDFPIANAIQPFLGGSGDAFVTHLNASGSAFIYSTYLGGTSYDGGAGIAVDSLGNAYIAGSTVSTDCPVVNAIQSALGGSEDAFVTKLNANGTALVFSTYLGGSANETEYGMGVDTSGNAYVTGWTKSRDFPTVNAAQSIFGGGDADAFITKISESGLSLHSPSPTSSPSALIVSPCDDCVDVPLQLVPDEARLKNQPGVVGGLVADGVTPLLMQFDPNPVPQQATTYTISTTMTGGTLSTGALDQYLLVLQQSGSVFQFVPGNGVTVSTTHPTGFAYISGIKSEDVQFDAGSKELSITLSVTKDGDSTPTATISFRIRKPPIVLVHGIFTDNSTWFTDETLTRPKAFLDALEGVFPSDFIMPVGYGVDTLHATFDAFGTLASSLDEALRTNVESASSAWHQGWAFTRYNIIGHSQGGLLARMLCTSKDPGAPFLPFRSTNNGFRGRFHRVVTLNSPHNGTTMYRYVADFLDQITEPLFSIPDYLKNSEVSVDKFDPFAADNQIDELRTDWPVDPIAKFNLVGTTINDGKPPRLGELLPACYSIIGLSGPLVGHIYTPGKIVIPSGSDGIVDYFSQFAGNPSASNATPIVLANIAHGGFEWALAAFADDGADPVTYVTDNVTTGITVAGLLNGPANNSFGSFAITPVDPALASQIDAVIPPVRLLFNIIRALTLAPGTQRTAGASATLYQFKLSPFSDNQPAGSPSWYAEVVGPNGVTSEGVTVTPDAGNPKIVTVTVEDAVLGDVILHVSYTDKNGNLITADPIVVVSRPPGETLAGIELVPNMLSLTVGSKVPSQVWGDYDNGTRAQLFIPSGSDIAYNSEDPAIATVDAAGNVQLSTVGATNINVSYLGFTAQSSVTVLAPPPPPVLAPLGAVSRKVHKAAGNFDLNLPLSGDEGIECRSGGRAGKYQMVATFASPITVASASVTSGAGTVSGVSVNGSQVTVDLASVTSAQRMTVTLFGVSDGTGTNDIVVPMAVLVGDTTGEGVVDNSDVSQVKLTIGQPVSVTNFREDVTADGRIDKRDSNTVRSNIGMQLPP